MVSTPDALYSGEAEQRLIAPQALPLLVKDWVRKDIDACIRWTGGPFAHGSGQESQAPTVFSTQHADQDQLGMPFFGDDLIRRVAESTGVELSPEEKAKLLKGVFFVDVPYRSIAYVTERQMDLGQNPVHAATESTTQVATSVTASDFLDAFLEAKYSLWEAKLAQGPVKGSVVKFGKEITLKEVLRWGA